MAPLQSSQCRDYEERNKQQQHQKALVSRCIYLQEKRQEDFKIEEAVQTLFSGFASGGAARSCASQ
jgi:hypothetical protein